jgi:ABC-2 type transport system permease protein/lipopolysaccharide transport system permease protein
MSEMTDMRSGSVKLLEEVFPEPAISPGPARWRTAVLRDVRELIQYWPVISNMVIQDLRLKYHRSILGFFWTLLNPILMMTTLAVVFSQIFRLDIKNYAVFLFSGMVPFNFLTAALTECSLSIVINEGLIRRIYLPKLIFPLVRVLVNLVILVLSLVALFVLLKPMGASFSRPMVLLPVVVLLWALFGLGLGLIVATLNTFYRDCSHLMTVFLQIWYFSTPVLYEASMFGERSWIFWLNPAFPFIRLFQAIIREGLWPDLITLSAAVAIAALSLGIGYAIFKTHEDKLVFRL